MTRIKTTQNNLRRLIKERELSLTDTAKLAGVSKQYLSQFLNDTSTKKEQLQDELCLILEISPARLGFEDPFPSPPGAVHHTPVSAEPMVYPLAQLAARLNHLYSQEDYPQLISEYNVLSPSDLEQFSARELADIQLVVGKALILNHEYVQGNALLGASLKLFQQRQTLQPSTFLPLILDCYRYLALSAYLQGDIEKALSYHQRLAAKTADLDAKSVSKDLITKLGPVFTNAVTLAKQTGNAEMATEFRRAARNFYRSHNALQGLEWLEIERLLSQAKVAHLFPNLDPASAIKTTPPLMQKMRILFRRVQHGVDLLQQELGISAGTSTEQIPDGFPSLAWQIQSYLILGRQDYPLLSRLEAPGAGDARIKLFSAYIKTLAAVFTDSPDQAWQALAALQCSFYSGDVQRTDYYLIAHCEAELALLRGHKQSALYHMLDALWCTRAAGEAEERLRLLARLRQMEVLLTPSEQAILQEKITEASNWLLTYWEEV